MNKLRKVLSATISFLIIFMLLIAPTSVSANSGEKEYITFEEACEKQWYNELGMFETARYMFYMPEEWKNEYNDYYDGKDPSTYAAGVFWWGTTANPDDCYWLQTGWPGYAVTQKEENDNNIFIMNLPEDTITIIFNNLVQAGMDSSEEVYHKAFETYYINIDGYDPDMDRYGFYPEGLDSMEGMIYVVNLNDTTETPTNGRDGYRGEWFYYYGNGEYGQFPTKDEAGVYVYSNGEFPQVSIKISVNDFDLDVYETVTCEADRAYVTATSADSSIATVEKSGDGTFKVTAVAEGNTKIIFNCYNEKTKEYILREVPVIVGKKNADNTEDKDDVEETEPDENETEPDIPVDNDEEKTEETEQTKEEDSDKKDEDERKDIVEKTGENINISGSGNDGENHIIILMLIGIMFLSLIVFVIARKRENNGV